MDSLNNKYNLAIVIPCWNCDHYIEGMLNSLLKQTYQSWNAFLIDDGSTDETASIIKRYSSLDARIHYKRRNRGPKGAQTCRNIGINEAKLSEYIVFFDADDLISSNCLQQRVQYMKEHPEDDFCIFPAKAFKTDIFDNTPLVYGIKIIDNTLQAMLNWNLPMVGWTNIYRYSSLIQYNITWDENLLSMQDSDFNIQSLISGMTYEFVEGEIDYFYRITNSGISNKIMSPKHIESHLYLLNKTLNSISRYSTNYTLQLKNFVVLFLRFFDSNPAVFKELFKIRWIRNHFMFYLKLRLYLVAGFRGKRILFKKQIDYSSKQTAFWKEQMLLNANIVNNITT